MPALPAIPVFSSTVLSSSAENQLSAAISFLFNPPRARLRQTVAQSLTSGAFAAITMDAEDFDLFPTGGSGGHSTSVNTSRFTAEFPGTYGFAGTVNFASSATGIRAARFGLNGAVIAASAVEANAITGNPIGVAVAFTAVTMVIGDYVELFGFQNSGGALNTSVATADASSMSVYFLGQ